MDEIVERTLLIDDGEPMPGEGSDVKIKYQGRDWRVRRRWAPIQPVNLAATPDKLAAVEYAVTISVAPLTKAGRVMKEADKFVTFPSHTVTLGSDLPDYDPKKALLCAIEDELERAHNRIEGRSALAKVISGMEPHNDD